MDIQILELIEGARKAEGLTVVIDVFRAFSLECYLADQGAEEMKAGEFKIRYTVITSNRFDAAAFKKLYGDLYNQFIKQTTSRRFSVA